MDTTTDKLSEILKRLNEGENTPEIKQEAKELLSSLNPQELSFAEQKLVEAGLNPKDLKHLCSIHMEMLQDEAEKLKRALKAGHVIHTMIREHEKILGFLDRLEKTNENIQEMENYNRGKNEFHNLLHIAKHLIEAEPHHKREEEIIFPEVEKRGVYGPPQVMRMEHEEFRTHKKEIFDLAKNVSKMNFDIFKKRLNTTVKLILLTLRDHIFKENNILYPIAVQIIQEKSVWKKMKEQCDKIGYCCFTPKV